MHRSAFFLSGLLLLCGCGEDTPRTEVKTYEFTFRSSTEGWTGDFADYPDQPDVDAFYELAFSQTTLPPPLNSAEGALKQSGNNHSDDLFMFIKRKISGLEPGKTYAVSMEVDIASNASEGSIGIGGSPGEAVFIKGGASTEEPQKVLDHSDNYYRVNIDKGNQAVGGLDMHVLGNFSNGTSLDVYTLKILRTVSSLNVKASAAGELWLIVGTDSGFEGATSIYYDTIRAELR